MAAVRLWTTAVLLVVAGCGYVGAESHTSFKSLKKAFTVTSQIEGPYAAENLARAGLDSIRVTWSLNASYAADAAAFREVQVKLCFAPPSQLNRKWRKGSDDLHKDKTCDIQISRAPYTAAAGPSSVTTESWVVEKNVPKATYFVRLYARNANGTIVAFGQTTDALKKSNLFAVRGISGRAASIDASAAVFSAFSLVALVGYYLYERRAIKQQSHALDE